EIKGLVLGGDAGFLKHISREFRYPEKAQWYGVSGKVYVNFQMDENFVKSDYSVTNNPGFGIGEEAIRLVKEGPLFIPPTKERNYTNVKLSIPITFALQ
ncbi:energy transducer TonB, partial [Maribacter sp. 2307UL18-2]|uniref:energy transducer TonB n=1 Tax=Maribacter sp. 2307UL18-2 TaxID=3386274 RepID=UPI0039BD2F09